MKFHPWIDQVIGDINQALRPRLGIVDGIIAQVGIKGPSFGVPIRANLVVMGKDPVAVDATCARILGFRPGSVGHLRECARRGLGKLNGFKVEFVGLDGGDLPHVPNLYNPLESMIIRWFLRISPLLERHKRR